MDLDEEAPKSQDAPRVSRCVDQQVGEDIRLDESMVVIPLMTHLDVKRQLEETVKANLNVKRQLKETVKARELLEEQTKRDKERNTEMRLRLEDCVKRLEALENANKAKEEATRAKGKGKKGGKQPHGPIRTKRGMTNRGRMTEWFKTRKKKVVLLPLHCVWIG